MNSSEYPWIISALLSAISRDQKKRLDVSSGVKFLVSGTEGLSHTPQGLNNTNTSNAKALSNVYVLGLGNVR